MTHYIYIHGFGGSYNWLRRLALRRWKKASVRVTLVPMRWKDQVETFEQKYDRVVAEIKPGEQTVLVGESAGGAMALLVYMHQPDAFQSVVTVCGYNHTAEDIWQQHRRAKPAFYPTVQAVDRSLSELVHPERVTTLYGRSDRVVVAKYSHVAGAREIQLPTRGHFVSIGYLLLKGPSVFIGRGEPGGV